MFRVQLPNGSLYISSVEDNRGLTGTYQCLLSSDGFGTIVSRSASISIASEYFLTFHVIGCKSFASLNDK